MRLLPNDEILPTDPRLRRSLTSVVRSPFSGAEYVIMRVVLPRALPATRSKPPPPVVGTAGPRRRARWRSAPRRPDRRWSAPASAPGRRGRRAPSAHGANRVVSRRCRRGPLLAQLLGTHVGVGQQRRAGETRGWAGSCAGDALLDGRGGLTRPAIRQLLVGDAGHVEMDVDAIQQRPTDPLLDEVANRVPM